MARSILDDAIGFVKNTFRDDYSGHDAAHTLRVCQTAARIAEREHADLLIVQLAALLHDVDDRKLSPETWVHQDRATAFLRGHGASDAEIRTVCEIIGEVSFRGTDSVVPKTVEGMCVQDADRLDAMGAIGIARAFAYGGSHHRVMYDPEMQPALQMDARAYHDHVSTTINHFYEKLFQLREMMNTDTAKQMAAERDAYMRAFVAEFLDEWNGVR